MPLESEYEATARELLAGHLQSDGLDARVDRDGVRLGIDRLKADIRIEAIEPTGDTMKVVYWALIDGYPGIDPPQMAIDLMGLGADAHEALSDAVHVLSQQVVPVLRADLDASRDDESVEVMKVSSETDGRATSWDLRTGPAGISSDDRERVSQAVREHVLVQGTLDSLVPFMKLVRPHWYKVMVSRGADGSTTGHIRIDGQLFDLVKSFASSDWPDGFALVRQFGILRPAKRRVDDEERARLEAAGGAVSRRSWLDRALRR